MKNTTKDAIEELTNSPSNYTNVGSLRALRAGTAIHLGIERCRRWCRQLAIERVGFHNRRIAALQVACRSVVVLFVYMWTLSIHAEQAQKQLTFAQQEAKRKCPLGPYDRCGELVGAYERIHKHLPPNKRTIGGLPYMIPATYAQNLDPTGYSNQLTAYWIPLAHKVDGTELAGTQFARESMKYGLMWPYGVRIKIETNRLGARPSTYRLCSANYIPKDSAPSKTAFGMTLYVDRAKEASSPFAKSDGCFVSDDSRFEFYPGVPVSYEVRYHNTRQGSTTTPSEERAVAGFSMRDDKVYVEYMFQTAMFAYWKEIHQAVLQLVQSWEQ
ncbi:MAG: hypothetical protein RL392_2535 [Pseudomonadota bacterium]|jgi:hypothetical protein